MSHVFRNLLFLKNYDGDVTDLNLDFTVAHNELGEIEVSNPKSCISCKRPL